MSPRCAYCQSPLAPDDARTVCPGCGATFHEECWSENRGCAVYGCPESPAVEARRAVEIPVSYWGQEHKPCPACGRDILAAAIRCRHCGAAFASARPEDAARFQERASLEARLPGLRRTIPWLFVACVIPCLTPIGVAWGLLWYPSRRKEIETLPSFYPALCKIGIGVGIAQLVAFALLTAAYSVLRPS